MESHDPAHQMSCQFCVMSCCLLSVFSWWLCVDQFPLWKNLLPNLSLPCPFSFAGFQGGCSSLCIMCEAGATQDLLLSAGSFDLKLIIKIQETVFSHSVHPDQVLSCYLLIHPLSWLKSLSFLLQRMRLKSFPFY